MQIRKPQQRPDEDLDAYHERIAAWESMVDAATPVKAARSQVAKAIEKVGYRQAIVGGPWYRREIPESQRARVAEWRDALDRVAEILDVLDLDAWQPEIAAVAEGSAGRTG